MKRYEIKVIVEEGNDEFWEGLKNTGVEEILEVVRESIDGVLVGTTVKLIKFEDKE